MSVNDNLAKNLDEVNKNLDGELKIQQLKEELQKAMGNYQKVLKYLSSDAPLEVLCLPKKIETSLLSSGCLRVYDLLDLDFTKIEGLNASQIRILTAGLHQFLSMF